MTQMRNKALVLPGALLLLLALLGAWAPAQVQAASGATHSIDITVALEENGDAVITEVWDITQNDGTERYMERINLDQQTISDLRVWEEGAEFENIGEWDVDASMSQKAGKCGIVTRSDGYELCWGLGSYGRHVFTVQYRMTNIVKSASDRDFIYQTFINFLDNPAQYARLAIQREGITFTRENTGIWAFGYSGTIELEEGAIVAESQSSFSSGSYMAVLVDFEQGLFAPAVKQDRNFEDIYDEAMDGSDYLDDYDDELAGISESGSAGDRENNALNGSGGLASTKGGRGSGYVRRATGNGDSGSSGFGRAVGAIVPVFIGIMAVSLIAGNVSQKHKKSHLGGMKPEYKNPEYSRELPFRGSLTATYTRLEDLNQLENEGDIIGAYLLQWVRSRQVELLKVTKNGFFSQKEEDAIKLYTARPDMQPLERQLYNMLAAAAGSDWILESKEFEKWSRSNYQKVETWLTSYKNQGKAEMRSMGAAGIVEEKNFFGLLTTQATRMTPEGEAMTVRMFGFKKYLQDFTIINERQAREVELWDEYLVFAQLFGIADTVAEQFKELYPDYFARMASDLGYGRPDMFDIYILTRMSRNYSRAMMSGYQAGYNASHASRSSGGGGFSSSGGGGSSSSGFGGSSGGR